ncbi:MAG: helix-turn-helix domain-containing protein [Ardenticatenaceae bacterium]
MSTLVEAYEEQHYAIPLPDPIAYILYYMESRALTGQDLEPYLGSQRRVAQVLNKERPLTMKMIRALNRGLNIAMDILVQRQRIIRHAGVANNPLLLLAQTMIKAGLKRHKSVKSRASVANNPLSLLAQTMTKAS